MIQLAPILKAAVPAIVQAVAGNKAKGVKGVLTSKTTLAGTGLTAIVTGTLLPAAMDGNPWAFALLALGLVCYAGVIVGRMYATGKVVKE